jgi:hypothetical protein
MARYTYPISAILLLVAAFLWFLVLIACYSTIAIALFPMSPFIFLGIACLLVSVYEHVLSVRKRVGPGRS